MLTRHQRGFPFSHPMPSLPLACSSRTEREPLSFPVSFTPGRYRPRASRRGQVTDTDPKSRRRHQSTSNRRTHSPRAASCRKHYAYLPALRCPITWPPSPCGRLSRPPWPVVTPATTNRVGGMHRCIPPPSELGGRAFPAPSSSKPRRAGRWSEVLALLAFDGS
jgi:hypothetical protein